MRILHRPSGRKKRDKKEKSQRAREKQEKNEKMPDFKKIFSSLPNIVNAPHSEPTEIETQHVPSVQDRAVAKSAAEQEVRTEAAKSKADNVFARIKTAKSRNLEIVWLLQADEDVPFKSVRELIESYRNMKDSDSLRGMSVNYAQQGKLHEISPLNEQDLDGLANKLEC